MVGKPTYEQLEQRVEKLEKETLELRRSQDFKTLVENSPDLIARFDRNFCHVYVNPAIIRETGISFDDYVGKSNRDLEMPEDLLDLWDPSLKSVFETGLEKEIEFSYQTPDGERIYQSRLVPELSEDGRVETVLAFTRDITRGKRLEQTLLESEQRYHDLYDLMRLITDNAPDLIWAKDMDDRFVFVNQTMCDKLLMCNTPDKAVGKTDIYFADQECKAGYKHTFGEICVNSDAVIKKRKAPGRFMEEGFVRNEYIVLDVHKAPLLNEKGEMIGTVGCGRDVTQEKETERILKESEGRLKAIFEAAQDCIFLKDSSLRYIQVNPCMERLFKLPAQKLIGKNDDELFGEQAGGHLREIDSRVLKGEIIHEEHTKPIDEIPTKFHVIKVPIRDDNGEVREICGIARDITNLKQTEEALRKSEEKYRTLAENSMTGIFIHQDGRFVFVNKRFADIHGYTPEELTGKDFLALIHPDEREASAQKVAKRLKKEPVIQRYEIKRLRKDGTTVWCEIMSTAIDYRGRPTIMGNIINIDKRKQVEERLIKSQEELRNLSAYLQSVREQERMLLARELHDELGQALTGLKMDLAWLENRAAQDPGAVLGKIKTMAELLDQTIRLTKRVITKLRLSILDDLGLIAAIEWQADEFADRTGIACDLYLNVDDKLIDIDHKVNMFRVFQECLTNIARHAGATMVKVNLKEKAGNMVLTVKDDGVGITPEQVSHPKSFGLMGMRERAYQFGGKFSITGVEGEGTTVIVTFPLPPAA